MSKQLTTEEFIAKAKEKHGDLYDYSLTEYKGNKTKVCIICPKHGEFWQLPGNHYKYHCNRCGIEKSTELGTKSQEEIIERFIKAQGDTYDYSRVEYKGMFKKVEIICKDHGSFWQNPNNHIFNKRGCPKCGSEKFAEYAKKKRIGLEDFERMSNLIHGNKYIYLEYLRDNKEKVRIECPTHGIFKQPPSSHLAGHGCPKCAGQVFDFDKFKASSKKMNENKYKYTSFETRNGTAFVKIVCPVHGEFEQNANNHRQGGQCPKCSLSRGESLILNFLNSIGASYVQQKTFDDCKNIHPLPFDFLVNFDSGGYGLIEYNGEQHFTQNHFFGGELGFKYRRRNDIIKREYCIKNNIPLLDISREDNVADEVKDFLANKRGKIDERLLLDVKIKTAKQNKSDKNLLIIDVGEIELHGINVYINSLNEDCKDSEFVFFQDEKFEIIESMAKQKSGKAKKIYARDCQVIRPDKPSLNRFLNRNHIGGSNCL